MNDHRRFFVVGAQRSGTTYLYHVLNEHPEIEMAAPLRPEPKFFLRSEINDDDLARYEAAHFSGQDGAWLRGEKSTSYIESEIAAQNIAAIFPEAKIIIIVRNPVERAISNYWFSVNNALETEPMAYAFRHEEERRENYDRTRFSVSPFAYLSRGRYIDYVALYERFFPPEQINILVFEQFFAQPERVQALYVWLGVSTDFVPPSLEQRFNASRKQDAPPLVPDLNRYLADYFAGPNAELAARLGIDLQQWGW